MLTGQSSKTPQTLTEIAEGWEDVTAEESEQQKPQTDGPTNPQVITPATHSAISPKSAKDKRDAPPIQPVIVEPIVVTGGSVGGNSGVSDQKKPINLKIEIPENNSLKAEIIPGSAVISEAAEKVGNELPAEIIPASTEKAGMDLVSDGPLFYAEPIPGPPPLTHEFIPPSSSPIEIVINPDAKDAVVQPQATPSKKEFEFKLDIHQPMSDFLKKIKAHRERFETLVTNLLAYEQSLKMLRGSISPIQPVQVTKNIPIPPPKVLDNATINDTNKLIRENINALQHLVKNHFTTLRYYNLLVTRGQELNVNQKIEMAQTSTLLFHITNTMLFRIHEDIQRDLDSWQRVNNEKELFQYLLEKGALLLIEDTIAKIEGGYGTFVANMQLPPEKLPVIAEEEAREIEKAYAALCEEELESPKSESNHEADSLLIIPDEKNSEPELPNNSVFVNPTPRFTDKELLDYCLEKLAASRCKFQVYRRLMDADIIDKKWFYDDYLEAFENYLNAFRQYNEFMDFLSEEGSELALPQSQSTPKLTDGSEVQGADLESHVISAPIETVDDSDEYSENNSEPDSALLYKVDQEESDSELSDMTVQPADFKSQNTLNVEDVENGDESENGDAKVFPYSSSPTSESEQIQPLLRRGSPVFAYGRMFSTMQPTKSQPIPIPGAGALQPKTTGFKAKL